jgi:C4-dicarboxylate-specific signal transduction histidine kinase
LLEHKLTHVQRLEAVGKLTGGIAHDFNNLLTIILGCTEILIDELDKLGNQPSLLELARLTESAAERGAQLTAQLLRSPGTGMSAEVLDHAFEPFFTTKPVDEGTGLGLSMVYGFVKQSDGHVSIYSEVGSGTTVKVFLPRAAGSPTPARISSDGPLPTGSEHILVVEDDPGLRGHVVRQLKGLGYRVTAAEDGRAALVQLAEKSDVALLFTDVVMPAMNSKRRVALLRLD